jgi:hypothetical protein
LPCYIEDAWLMRWSARQAMDEALQSQAFED